MNFDGKTAIKETPLRAPGVVLNNGSTFESTAITPSGFSHAIFYVTTNITGSRAISGKLQDSADNSQWADVAGTSFTQSVADGDGQYGLRTILIAHNVVKSYCKARWKISQELALLSVRLCYNTSVVCKG